MLLPGVRRRFSISFWFMCAVSSFVVCGNGCQQPADLDPILLITVETLRSDHLPFYGYERDTAPFLTKLADTSVVFTNAHSVSSWTPPAFLSLLVGVHPAGHNIEGKCSAGELYWYGQAPPESVFLSETMAKAGYSTHAVVASPYLDSRHGLTRGFQSVDILRGGVDYSDARLVTHRAIQIVSEAKKEGRPLFLWLHYFDPHYPYHARSQWDEAMTLDQLAAAKKASEDWPTPDVDTYSPELIRIGKGYYDSEIRFVDQQIERLFSAAPHLNRSFLIVAGDHGEEFGEHGSFDHGANLHAETVRIPLLVRPPGGIPRQDDHTLVSILDVAPTLVKWANVFPATKWQGHPLPGLSLGHRFPHDRPVFASLEYEVEGKQDMNMDAVIDGDWKLITNGNTGRAQLFNLHSDANERTDLADTHRERRRQLSTLRSKIVASYADGARPIRGSTVPPEKAEELRSLGYIE